MLHHLKNNDVEWLQPFGELLSELERPELLFLALLLHDTGKGLAGTDHVHNSLQLAAAAVERMGLPVEDVQTVCFLIATHLEMSSTMRRRDIYDPETVRELAGKIGTPERLKMLTLLTLADIKSVNPEALTPWKAENLWRLYAGTATYFDHSVDEERFHADVCTEQVERVAALLPKRRSQLLKFLDGLPQRYLMSHSPDQVILHFEMAEPPAQRTGATRSAAGQRAARTHGRHRRSPRLVLDAGRNSLRMGHGHHQGQRLLQSRRGDR